MPHVKPESCKKLVPLVSSKQPFSDFLYNQIYHQILLFEFFLEKTLKISLAYPVNDVSHVKHYVHNM